MKVVIINYFLCCNQTLFSEFKAKAGFGELFSWKIKTGCALKQVLNLSFCGF